MDVVRFGLSIRALRRRRRWRQLDLAGQAGVSRAAISRVERGRADRLTVRALQAVAGALGARLDCRLLWNGEALDRLLDESHAALVEIVLRWLAGAGWDAAPEVSFSIRGERGSIDVLAFHPATATVLIVEVKSVVPDLQATLVTIDRKTRLASEIARGRGWRPAGVGRLLVLREDRTARRRVAAHEATFAGAFPARGRAVRAWVRRPASGAPAARAAGPSTPAGGPTLGSRSAAAGGPTGTGNRNAFSGLIFVSGARQAGARHRVAAPASGHSVANSPSGRLEHA
jgi:transcriptional regulator with XRE-family HTH domain